MRTLIVVNIYRFTVQCTCSPFLEPFINRSFLLLLFEDSQLFTMNCLYYITCIIFFQSLTAVKDPKFTVQDKNIHLFHCNRLFCDKRQNNCVRHRGRFLTYFYNYILGFGRHVMS